MTATYENHRVTVTCDEHGTQFGTYVTGEPDPDADVAAIVESAVRAMWRRVDEGASGSCGVCGKSLPPVEFDTGGDAVRAVSDCDHCYHREENFAGLFVLTHPAVVSFYYERGVDVRRQIPATYAREWVGSGELVAEDPDTVELTLARDGDELPMRVDDRLHVEPA